MLCDVQFQSVYMSASVAFFMAKTELQKYKSDIYTIKTAINITFFNITRFLTLTYDTNSKTFF